MFKSRAVAVFTLLFVTIAFAGCNAANKPEAGKSAAGTAAPVTQKASMPKDAKVVAEIGNDKITLEEIDTIIEAMPEPYKSMAASRKDMFVDSVVNQRLLYAAALKENLDKDAKVRKDIEEASKTIIVNEYLKREIEQKAKVSDEDVKKYYENNKDKFKEPEKVKVSHIVVETEQEAKDALGKLKGGADFAAMAKEKSKCPSKDKGGSLGFIAKGQTVPEFEQVAFSLKPGQLSEVVKTQFGYHIIKVEEKEPEKQLAFDDVKDQLKRMLISDKQKEIFETLVKDLKDKNKVVVHTELLPPSPQLQEDPDSAK